MKTKKLTQLEKDILEYGQELFDYFLNYVDPESDAGKFRALQDKLNNKPTVKVRFFK